jgi:hypothetical protein
MISGGNGLTTGATTDLDKSFVAMMLPLAAGDPIAMEGIPYRARAGSAVCGPGVYAVK